MSKVQINNQKLNKTAIVAAASALAVLLMSFLAAPFIRVFALTAKSLVYWSVGVLLIASLSVFNLSIASIYVGSVWMTLGLYNEFEKRGMSWKKTSLAAILFGFLSAVIGLFIIADQKMQIADHLNSFIIPLENALKGKMSSDEIIKLNIGQYLIGIFASALAATISLAIMFENQIFKLFNMQREKISTSIKWIEFKVPEIFIWSTLISLFLVLIDFQFFVKSVSLKVIASNVLIFCSVVLFFQGLAIVEYILRFYGLKGLIKILIYFIVLGWMGPAVIALGITDYWMDFRKKLRLQLK